MVKIVVADKMEKEVVDQLHALGQVVFQPVHLATSLKDADVLIVRSATQVTEELLASAPKLKIVARAGVGLDNVDKAACGKRGILIINTPAASTNAVAELAIGHMISLLRKTGMAHQALCAGKWAKSECVGREIYGKTLGIAGMGRIGGAVARKAALLGMKVVYHSHHEEPDLLYPYYAALDEMLPHVDVLSLHASAQKGSPPLLGAAQFAKMKKGAYLINTARGALVDEPALLEALKSGHLAGAALDVYSKEPKKADEPLPEIISQLARLNNVLLTPHIGASTHEAQARIGEDLISQLRGKLA